MTCTKSDCSISFCNGRHEDGDFWAESKPKKKDSRDVVIELREKQVRVMREALECDRCTCAGFLKCNRCVALLRADEFDSLIAALKT